MSKKEVLLDFIDIKMADRDDLKGKKSVTRSASSEQRHRCLSEIKQHSIFQTKKAKNIYRGGKYKKGKMKRFTVTADILNSINCARCNEEFNTEEVMLIECKRYSGWQCITCAEMEKVEYDLMVKRKELHCKGCEQHALSVIQVDRESESKCAKYMETVNSRIEGIEKTLETKNDKTLTDELFERCRNLKKAVFANDKSPEPKVKN